LQGAVFQPEAPLLKCRVVFSIRLLAPPRPFATDEKVGSVAASVGESSWRQDAIYKDAVFEVAAALPPARQARDRRGRIRRARRCSRRQVGFAAGARARAHYWYRVQSTTAPGVHLDLQTVWRERIKVLLQPISGDKSSALLRDEHSVRRERPLKISAARAVIDAAATIAASSGATPLPARRQFKRNGTAKQRTLNCSNDRLISRRCARHMCYVCDRPWRTRTENSPLGKILPPISA
jgi:hypothetical protein